MVRYKFPSRRDGVAKLRELGLHAEDDFNISYIYPDPELPPNYPINKHNRLPKSLGSLERDGTLVIYEDIVDPVIREFQDRIKIALELNLLSEE